MKRVWTLALGAVAVSLVGAAAQELKPMTPDDVMSLRSVSDPQISPDGKWVAYVVSAVDMKENAANADIWVVSTADGAQPYRLTSSKKSDNEPRWSPDGKRLAFVSAREEKPQIFLISPFGGEAERLTESKSGAQSPQWSPDGKRIAYLAEQEPTEEEEKKQKEKDDVQLVDQDFKYRRLWVIDVDSKKADEIVSEPLQVADPQWSPDGRQIAYSSTPTPKADDGSVSDVWVVEVETKTRRKLIENEGGDNAPRWSPDGSQIALLTVDGKKNLLAQRQLVIVPAAGGTPRAIAKDFLYESGPARWSPDGRTIYFTSPTRTTSQLYSVAAAGGEPKAMSAIDGLLDGLTLAKDGSIAAFTKGDPDHPSDVHVTRSLASFAPVKLTDHNPAVRELALGRSEVIRWKSKDGLEVEGRLIYPIDYRPGTRYPLIVHVHGGPAGRWASGFPGGWGNYGHVWAGKGWISFYPNPRGSSGYGEKFLLANVRDWGGGDYQDIQSGVDVLIEKGLVDPNRMGQSGWSYGGYMTAWTLTQTNRFKALMVGAGLTNMFSMYSTNDLQRVLDAYFGAEPWDDTEIYYTRSAMNFIKQARTPTLIMHGGADRRVPVGQAQELYMGLRKNEVGVEMAVYPREPHGLQEPRHQLDKMQREYAWFAKHVLGETATSTGSNDSGR